MPSDGASAALPRSRRWHSEAGSAFPAALHIGTTKREKFNLAAIDTTRTTCHFPFMTCVLKAVLATILLFVLCFGAGEAAVADVDGLGHSVGIAAVDPHSGQDGESGHGSHRDYCAVSVLHCGVSYLSPTTVANVHRSAWRNAFLLADDQLLAGCLHEALTPPPRS